jgi:hypothetical protein
MLASLLGYFFCTITMLTAVAVLLTSFANISLRIDKGRLHLRPPVIERTVATDETAQPHPASPPAKGVSSVIATAKADTKKSKQYKPKVFADSPTTMAMGTGWVMPKNVAGQKVSFSADPAPEDQTGDARDGYQLCAKIGNQTDRLAHSLGKRPAELAGRFETRTAPMVTFGAGDTGAVVDLASG